MSCLAKYQCTTTSSTYSESKSLSGSLTRRRATAAAVTSAAAPTFSVPATTASTPKPTNSQSIAGYFQPMPPHIYLQPPMYQQQTPPQSQSPAALEHQHILNLQFQHAQAHQYPPHNYLYQQRLPGVARNAPTGREGIQKPWNGLPPPRGNLYILIRVQT